MQSAFFKCYVREGNVIVLSGREIDYMTGGRVTGTLVYLNSSLIPFSLCYRTIREYKDSERNDKTVLLSFFPDFNLFLGAPKFTFFQSSVVSLKN